MLLLTVRNMESVIISNEEETSVIYLDEEQLADIVKLKVAGIICNVTLMEWDVAYDSPIENIYLIH